MTSGWMAGDGIAAEDGANVVLQIDEGGIAAEDGPAPPDGLVAPETCCCAGEAAAPGEATAAEVAAREEVLNSLPWSALCAATSSALRTAAQFRDRTLGSARGYPRAPVKLFQPMQPPARVGEWVRFVTWASITEARDV